MSRTLLNRLIAVLCMLTAVVIITAGTCNTAPLDSQTVQMDVDPNLNQTHVTYKGIHYIVFSKVNALEVRNFTQDSLDAAFQMSENAYYEEHKDDASPNYVNSKVWMKTNSSQIYLARSMLSQEK